MNYTTEQSKAANLNYRELRQIAQHYQINLVDIIEVQEWVHVLWVKFKKNGKKYCRFLSYKVIWLKLPQENGLYWVGNKVFLVQFAAQESFRLVNPLTKEVAGWFELYPHGGIFRGYDHNGERLDREKINALIFQRYIEKNSSLSVYAAGQV